MAKLVTLMVCLTLMFLAVPNMAMTYTVGDSAGWALGVDYGTWASANTFTVGDTLVFSYGSSHAVSEVSASDYTSCSLSNAVTTDTSGATSIPLKTAGTHYFICGVMGHCDGGMKLAVTVTGGDTTIPSESATAPTPSTTTISQPPLMSTAPATAPPSTTTISQPPLIPTTMTSAFSPTSSENIVPPLSSNADTLSPFNLAVMIACSAMIFKVVLA